mmetsp:Transcript_64449/g.119895  ORF Transcript_64449/g.119895 Transcript_64449/m.119895 type:complete len:460 (+) Transcript_64449:103-1482(+)
MERPPSCTILCPVILPGAINQWGQDLTLCVYLATYLSPANLARLLAAASYGAKDSQRAKVWRMYFLDHWGAQSGVTKTAKVRVMRSWTPEESASWPLATVGFWGASSAMDHVFWLLPFLRCAFRLEPPEPVAQPTESQAWQLAVRVRAANSGGERTCCCFICDVLEILPPLPFRQHFRQRWVRPCATCEKPAHKSCLEKLLQKHRFQWRAAATDDTQAQRQALQRHQHNSGLLKDDRGELPELRCHQCGSAYWVSQRFPENMSELMLATFKEWQWVLRKVIAIFFLFMWMEMIMIHYLGLESISSELCILLLFTACIMSVTVAARFHRGVQLIWNTPHRWRYLCLFCFYALLTYMVSVLRIIEPSMWAQAPQAVQQWQWHRLSLVYSVSARLHSSAIGSVLLSGISLCYLIAASGIMFLFWKTSLRVPTVADAKMDSTHQAVKECGLCQLGLCLDNPCM